MNLEVVLISFCLAGLEFERNWRLNFRISSSESAIQQHINDTLEPKHSTPNPHFATYNFVNCAMQLPLHQLNLGVLSNVSIEPLVQLSKFLLKFLLEGTEFVAD